uniref:Saposin B-type domain-containing protein n=1 Tax=Amblyomma maculatum TaxID=34609 RepID=G3MTH5_AMBMU
MTAFLASCLFMAPFMAAASAHHLNLCEKNNYVLATELECIRNQIPPLTNAAFEIAVQALGCRNDFCAIRTMCAQGDLEAAMSQFLMPSHIRHIHYAATACDPHVQSYYY